MQTLTTNFGFRVIVILLTHDEHFKHIMNDKNAV